MPTIHMTGNLKKSIEGIKQGDFAFIDIDLDKGLVTVTTATKTVIVTLAKFRS